ncbi:MAG: hypothetical protein LBG83_01130 [Oscillospiraceae bacterium]|jgi:diacylglycerol kinase family enzyme|nr:hypothetical protein [Oscillospiraceae bacterium]
MRHVFAINPYSGKGSGITELPAQISAACAEAGIVPELYNKPDKEGMLRFVREAARTATEEEPVRVYACGGDGTLYCVVNATWGCPHVQIAAVPFGSGNDFIRLFGVKEELQDIRLHINGTPHWIDAIDCESILPETGESVHEIAINQCSMGLDAEVCAKQAAFKKLPWMTGEFAYTASSLYCITQRFHSEFTVQIDDQPPVKGPFLFALGGNSRWYGGGYKGCPRALPDDGLLDCIVVRKEFGRLKLLSLLGKYKNGEHLSWPFTNFQRGKKMHIHSDELAAVNVDGECRYVNDSTFQLVEKAVCYVIPKGSAYLADREAGKL